MPDNPRSTIPAAAEATTDLTPEEIREAGKQRHGVSDGEVLCGHCETDIPKGEPLHWPAFPISQYDDTDAICTSCVRDILNTDWSGYGEAMEAASGKA